MYFVVSKLTFEKQVTSRDARDLSALVDKLRSRFKISVQIAEEFQKSNVAAIVIAAVHPQENTLNQMVDEIVDLCENSGFGRVESENTIFEDFDSFNDSFD